MRVVILHYHLFKNAGSTIDAMLQATFGERWMSFDKGQAAGKVTPGELAAFLLEHATCQAVSSHQAMLPLPDVPETTIFPILFLRHPLDRARSVYTFERKQGLNGASNSLGAQQAARLSCADYLLWRWGSKKNGMVHNYQTFWLLHERRFGNKPITEKDFEQACRTLNALPFFGLVESFDDSMRLLDAQLQPHGINVSTTEHVVNRTHNESESLPERLEAMREEIGDAMWEELQARNRWDLKLHEVATQELTHRMEYQSIAQVQKEQA